MYNIIILGITSFLTDLSTEMVYPLLPLYLTTLGASPAIIGFIEGIAESLASFLKVFSGYISDRIGKRKPLVIIGYSSSTLGKIFLYLSFSWHFVFIGRVIDRFGKGVRTAPRDALLADSSTKQTRGKSFGYHRMLDTFGATIGVSFAYYFFIHSKFDYKYLFLISLIPAFLAVFVLSFAKEKKENIFQKISFYFEFKNLDKRLKIFLIIVFIFSLANSSNLFLLLRAKNLGMTESKILLVYLIYNISYGVFSYPAGKLSDKIGRKKILIAGYFFYGIVYLLFGLINSLYFLFFLFPIYGIYIALTEGVEKAFISDLSTESTRATLIGLHSTLVGIGLFPASFLAGIFWNIFGASFPFYFGGVLGFLASFGLLLFI